MSIYPNLDVLWTLSGHRIYSTKRSKFGEIGLHVPHDRKSKFEPQIVNKCTAHQIRYSFRNVSLKERKAMAKDFRLIYEAATEEEGSAALEQFSEKLDKRYPHVSSSWKENWVEIATFFKYPLKVRAFIHTTNLIESVY